MRKSIIVSFNINTKLIGVIKNLQDISEDAKYVIGSIILERRNNGFHFYTTCYWDVANDTTITARYDASTMYVILTIFAVSL